MEKKQQGRYSRITFILLLLGVLVLVNLISINIFTRIDLTEGKIFTLAPASRDAVKNLEDRLTVKAFFTKELPPPYSSNARYLRDQLEEYRAHSNGKFQFAFVDPTDDKELESEARNFQIAPVQVNVVEADKIELKKVYMGLVFLYQDKRETIPLIQSTAGLEYDITSTIKKITAERIPSIGFLSGQGEAAPFEEMSGIVKLLQKNYQVQAVDVSEGKMVPEDVEVLMIVRPEFKYSDWALFALDQFLMRGGRLAFLVNKIEANLQEAQAKRNAELNLDEFTQNYGFRIGDDLVYDQKCGMVTIRQASGFFTIQNSIPYPYFPNLRNFDQDNAIVKNLEELLLYFPSSIESQVQTDSMGTSSVEFKPLAWTSAKSGRAVGRFNINPTLDSFKKLSFPDSGIVVAATLTGIFDSYFKGKGAPDSSLDSPYRGEILEKSPATRIVVIGDGYFPLDGYLTSRSSADFFQNLVDWLAQDESLIHIRTREVTSRPLADTAEGLKGLVKYMNIFLPPVVIVVIGLVRWQLRRRRRLVL